MHEKEQRLIKFLKQYPDIVQQSADHYKPSLLARHIFAIAQSFNEFYHACPILQAGDKEREARLSLIAAAKCVLENGMALMGIIPLRKM